MTPIAGVLQLRDAATLQSETRLRPGTEILDALDLTFRAHRAVTDARVRKSAPLEAVNAASSPSAITRCAGSRGSEEAAWNDVTTPT